MKESANDGRNVNCCHSICLCLNVQGINPSLRSKSFHKIRYLSERINHLNHKKQPVSFMAIVETWLKEHITDAQLHIQDYNIYRSDRSISKNGGVMLYIHNSITIDTFSLFDDDTCSAVICLSKNSNCIICCLYRPPNSSYNSFRNTISFLNNFILSHNTLDKLQIFLFGDFNFPNLSWHNDQITEYNTLS